MSPDTRALVSIVSLTTILVIGACSSPASPDGALTTDVPTALSVQPSAAATGVDPAKPIVITFNMAMMSGMEMLVVVHEGSVTGHQVSASGNWSADRHTLTITPASTLKAKMTYVVHLSPSLAGTNGKMIDLLSCAKIGGQYVSGGMMGPAGGGMMSGTWGPGMMGAGWQATDGTFGMVFTFTTS